MKDESKKGISIIKLLAFIHYWGWHFGYTVNVPSIIVKDESKKGISIIKLLAFIHYWGWHFGYTVNAPSIIVNAGKVLYY